MYHIKIKNNQNHSISSQIIRKHTRKILKYTYGIEKENSLLLKLGQKIIINALEEKTKKVQT